MEITGTGPSPARRRIPADTFAHRLMLARAMAGHLSIRDAAELTGLNRGSWQAWERGMRPRDILDVARRVADKLDVDHDWLLFGGPLDGDARRRVRDIAPYSGLPDRRSAVAHRPPNNRPPVRPETPTTIGVRRTSVLPRIGRRSLT